MDQVLDDLKVWLNASSWMSSQDVKCKGQGLTSMFYPSRSSGEVARAKAVCNGLDGFPPCPLRNTCLRHAIDMRENMGVWGGTSERDRKKIRKARRKYGPHVYSYEDVAFPGTVKIHRQATIVYLRRRAEDLSVPLLSQAAG